MVVSDIRFVPASVVLAVVTIAVRFIVVVSDATVVGVLLGDSVERKLLISDKDEVKRFTEIAVVGDDARTVL